MTAIGDLLDLREDVVEVLRPLEEPEAAGVHVREVQDRQDALCVLHERQDFVQAADDLRASARLDPEAGVDLRLLVRVPDGPEVLGDPIQGLLRIELPEHAEVRNHDRSAHRLREHAAPDHALDALLGEPVRVREVHVVWRVQRQLDVQFPREIAELFELVVVPGDAGGEAVQDVPFLDLLVQRGREDFLPLLLPPDLDDQLRRDLPRRAADVVLARVPFVQVHADQLDLHRRQAEIVDVLDSVPQGPPLARQWDARRPKTNHALTERRMATARLLFCKA